MKSSWLRLIIFLGSFAGLFGTTACTADLEIPQGIVLDCEDGADCPEGSSCSELEDGSGNVCVTTDEPSCGNGVIETGEACDDGNRENGDYGSADCLLETSVCGDGNRETGEVCDHDGEIDGWYCNDDCLSFRKDCGDGFVAVSSDGRTGELCDEGSENTDSYQLSPGCLSDCSGYGSYCGDGEHDVEAGEACDDGNSLLDGATETNPDGNGCSATCTRLGSCGDGLVQYGFEDCDDSNTVLESCLYGQESCYVCNGSCALEVGETSFCGDGVVSSSNDEVCDSGPVLCAEISSAFISGSATCSECDYWDTSGCTVDTTNPEKMTEIPGGLFWQGCDDSPGSGQAWCLSFSVPYHETQIDSFFMGTYEVTVLQYRACVDSGACSDEGVGDEMFPQGGQTSPEACNYNSLGRDNHPMNCVLWQEAKDYCAWVQQRLPTSAEWEKGSRGTDGRSYPWGNSPDPSCTHVVISNNSTEPGGEGCGEGTTQEVGTKPLGLSPYGLHDMGGNVAEWTADWFSNNYFCAGNDATYADPFEDCSSSSSLSDDVVTNPQGVPFG